MTYQTERDNLIEGIKTSLTASLLGSCDCGTISPEPGMHDGYCRMLKLLTALERVEELEEELRAALDASPAGEDEKCPACNGSGHRDGPSYSDPQKMNMYGCGVCKGTGTLRATKPADEDKQS